MLSTNEIVIRAKQFAEDWASAHYEKGETQTFYNEFFEIFGVKRRQVARYEEHVKKLDNKAGFIDLFWPGILLVEQKSAGRDLRAAEVQAGEYFDALKDSEKPRWQLLSDFQTFELLDRETRQHWSFTLRELPEKIERFNFIRGVTTRKFVDQDPANVEASEIMGALHDELKASGYGGHDLERYLVRLLFVLFADDTGIFEPRDIFLDLLESRTREDGSDTGPWLHQLFEVLDTPEEERQSNLDGDLVQFPYVNGDLFKGGLRTASFGSAMRQQLIEATKFNWSKVSPAIFGSLFQSVMNAKERRQSGAHYTTETNIMKVIGPLFLDELRAEFERLKARKDGRRRGELEAFRRRLGTLTFFDPACGCGNFLVIAYRELRQLELDVVAAALDYGPKLAGDESRGETLMRAGGGQLSVVDVDQFFGIEIGEFPARIAEVAMWMMDHIMNNRLSLRFNQSFARIPLRKSAHISCADALEIDWNKVLPADQCSYVFGNPPFSGAKYQSELQRQQVRTIARLGGSGGTLDFVAAWFIKAGEYIRSTGSGAPRTPIAFVATNSITQGEQVAQLWPIVFDRLRFEIAFAHRTFVWTSEARGKAHVHVVILGLTPAEVEPENKRLFSYDAVDGDPTESTHRGLTAYLFDAGGLGNRHLVVEEASKPINNRPRLVSGTQPIDDGNLIFTEEEKVSFVAAEPSSAPFFRPYAAGKDWINGDRRWLLHLWDCPPALLRTMPLVVDRLRAVSTFRAKSDRVQTKAIANLPTRYNVEVVPTEAFLVIPESSSERRDYAPIGWLQPPTIPSNLLRLQTGARVVDFGVLTSSMHMAWLRNIGGRIKSDYRYSIGLVYNTFPWPQMTLAQEQAISDLAQAVLDARASFPTSTLGELYDPNVMPPTLRMAHRALDLAVDRLYRRVPFGSERERVEHLFGLYERMVAPLTAAPKRSARRR
ncbi:MAG: DNA methyltransferase [Devosia sp.]